jgi:hypothetical protein
LTIRKTKEIEERKIDGVEGMDSNNIEQAKLCRDGGTTNIC